MVETKAKIAIAKEEIKITEIFVKKANKSSGIINPKAVILNKFRGPFLSAIIPNKGPINIKAPVWHNIKNCKALPSIPIKAPNVLPVAIIKDVGKLDKNTAIAILQNLNVLSILIIFFFLFSVSSLLLPKLILQ